MGCTCFGCVTTRETWPVSNSRSRTSRVLFQPEIRESLVAAFRSFGFKFITLDLEGFRSGSLNTLISITNLVDQANAKVHV